MSDKNFAEKLYFALQANTLQKKINANYFSFIMADCSELKIIL